MKPTDKDFASWVKQGKRHPFYKSTVTAFDELMVHYTGEFPGELIKERRPTESAAIQDFREKIYVGKTVGPVGKVVTSLSKIRKASDYSIQFKDNSTSSRIKEDESLENYTTLSFPKNTSLDNWFWSVCFSYQLMDSNAISVLMPMNTIRKDNEYVKPYPIIFTSDQIFDYQDNQYYFVKSHEISYYQTKNETREGDVYYYIDKEGIYKYSQANSKGEYTIDEIIHGLGYAPVVKLHGVVQKDMMRQSLYRSRLSPMIPELKEAVREYSDLQAGVLQSMFPTYWYYSGVKCVTCNGVGSIPSKSGSIECKKCKGKGDFPFNPYEHISMSVKDTEIGKNPAPTPPGGIIEKDTKIIEIQDKRVQDHVFNALAAVNMEHLALVPLSQSGTSKEWDRQEANNFVYAIGEDSVRILDNHYRIISDYRYMVVIPDPKKRAELLPMINAPYKFDLSSDSAAAADVKVLKDGKFNQSIIGAAELDYANRKFVTDPDLRDLVQAQYQLDPVSGKSEDDILMGNQNGWISDETAIIHANIKEFIERAIEDDAGFLKLEIKIKKEKIMAMAEEFIKDKSAKSQVMNNIAPPIPQPPVDPNNPIDPNATGNNK